MYSLGPGINLVTATWSSADASQVTVETFTALSGHSQRLIHQGQLTLRHLIFGGSTWWQIWNTLFTFMLVPPGQWQNTLFLMREKPKPHNVGAQDKSPLLSDLNRKEAKDLEAVHEILNTWCHICISFRLRLAEPWDKNYNRHIAWSLSVHSASQKSTFCRKCSCVPRAWTEPNSGSTRFAHCVV